MEWLPSEIIGQDAGAWFRLLVVLGVFLLGFWKALPSVLDAFERKQSGIELRTEALLDAQARRFEAQLAAADSRHDECMEGQRLLRAELAELYSVVNAMRQGAASVENMVARTIKDARNENNG
jgi:hypothetical protein|tara:strand:+ start:42220 stop:42588 length:369 start_codon:yes stop_codon:yes gene_type:complete